MVAPVGRRTSSSSLCVGDSYSRLSFRGTLGWYWEWRSQEPRGPHTRTYFGSFHRHELTPTRSSYWCWIGPDYKLERLAGEYVWIWIALFASVFMYIPLFIKFWTQGRLSIDPEKWYKFRFGMPDGEYPLRRAALGMLL